MLEVFWDLSLVASRDKYAMHDLFLLGGGPVNSIERLIRRPYQSEGSGCLKVQ